MPRQKLQELVLRCAKVGVMLLVLTGCETPMEDRTPIVIAPEWKENLARAKFSVHDYRYLQENQKQVSAAEKVVNLFIDKHSISKNGDIRFDVNVFVSRERKNDDITIRVFDEQYRIIVFTNAPKTDKAQFVITCDHKVNWNLGLRYESGDDLDEEFLYRSLEKIFSWPALCTR